MRPFADDLDGGVHRARIQADFDGGVRSGVRGTPTLFANGLRHDGSYDAAALLSALRGTTTAG
jgi:protein-disulfide isomerase